jgi:hypothetical protein
MKTMDFMAVQCGFHVILNLVLSAVEGAVKNLALTLQRIPILSILSILSKKQQYGGRSSTHPANAHNASHAAAPLQIIVSRSLTPTSPRAGKATPALSGCPREQGRWAGVALHCANS